jgi:DNA-binding response OmpR family regulator
VQRGWLQLLAEEEMWETSECYTPAVPAKENSEEIVCISQDQEINEQITAIVKQAGYIPVIIHDPIAALSTVARSQPQLIFCALELSHWSGEQVIQTLKTIPTLAQTPIILLTPETYHPIRLIKAQLLGATASLAQPIDESELLKLLDFYLQSAQ